MVRRRKWATGFGVIAVVAVLVGLTTAGANAQQNSALALPRNTTVYVSGSAWGPYTSFNPLRQGYATGTLGLLYETPAAGVATRSRARPAQRGRAACRCRPSSGRRCARR